MIMKLINLFHLTLFLFFSTSSMIGQSYMTLDDDTHKISYSGAHLDLAIPTNPTPYNVLNFVLNGGDGGDRYVNYELTSYRAKGGKGATTYCSFQIGTGSALEPGGTLRFIVGEKGQGTNGIGTEGCGGGGGTGLLYLAPGLDATDEDDWVILAVAGGGGGAYANGVGGTKDGKGGNDGPDGTNGHNSSSVVDSEHGLGGEDGEGGLASDSGEAGGAGGGGYQGNGQDIFWASAANCNGTGGSKGGILGGDGGMDDSCIDGRDGGWGYGGGGSGEAAGGGGGGYSGGGGGTSGIGYSSGGGGGGSYVDDTLAETYSISPGGTTSDPENGYISYQFEADGPSINSCNTLNLTLNSSGELSISAALILDEYYAPTGSTISLSQSNFDCDDVGANIVSLTITDTEGNTATCSAGILIFDSTAPTATCASTTLYLDANGSASLSPNDIGIADDACDIAQNTIDQTSFDCTDIGDNIVTFTSVDESSNSSMCTATVTVRDEVAPVAICQSVTIQLDANGQASTTANAIDDSSSDVCGIQSLIINQSDFDCDNVGSNSVTLTASDVNGNSSTCSTLVTVQDQVSPMAICQNVTIQLDANGQASTTAGEIDDNSSDACGIQSLTITQSDYDCSEIGSNIVTMTVTDVNGNSNTCSATVTVEDNIAPSATCQDLTVTFNGETNIDWTIDQIWDEDASSDNCVDVFAVSQSLSQATCDQLGMVLTATVTIEDGSGNESTCNAYVTVDGLPCGWYSDVNSINCTDAQTDYDTNTEEFLLTSNGCYDASYYRSADTHGFIQTELCGDGEITAQVTGLIGTGWAGITMRESNEATAKMIQLMINGSSMTRREVRMSTGGVAFAHQYLSLGNNWLKLSRSGNQFRAYQSTDGVNWNAVFVSNLSMPNCIEVGLISMNGASNGALTGLFKNVSFSGTTGYNLQASENFEPVLFHQVDPGSNMLSSLQLYPNPTRALVNIGSEALLDQPLVLRVYNHYGQVILKQTYQHVQTVPLKLSLEGFSAGAYLVEVLSGDQRTTKKLVKY